MARRGIVLQPYHAQLPLSAETCLTEVTLGSWFVYGRGTNTCGGGGAASIAAVFGRSLCTYRDPSSCLCLVGASERLAVAVCAGLELEAPVHPWAERAAVGPDGTLSARTEQVPWKHSPATTCDSAERTSGLPCSWQLAAARTSGRDQLLLGAPREAAVRTRVAVPVLKV